MFVIGTAGHVDHGKSALVRALTGIDPDRLQEEKDRGMTIDLGFAWLRLPGGTEVSIVDVPGHERFIKNMLAGVGGIDLALLVVAADEGVMPQTREHLAILDLLGVRRGVIAVTKSDLVDADFLDLVAAEVEDAVAGTVLAGSPMVRCSATTREGLEELLQTLEQQLATAEPKRDIGRPRLPIDRVFTVAGFGTVVTGTLIDGSLRAGQELEVVPAVVGGHLTSLPTRVRGVQTHRAKVEQAIPGTRTAANLAGLEPEQLERGQVATTPGWLKPSLAVDVRLRSLASLGRPLRHNLHVSFHSLAAESPARMRLLDLDELPPGGEAWAQLRLQRPLALVKGDRFIIRDANETIGGGTIVQTSARRHPRRRPSVIEALERLQTEDPAEALFAAIAAAEPAEIKSLASRTSLPDAGATSALDALAAQGRVLILGGLAFTASGFDRLRLDLQSAVDAYLAAHPLRLGLGKEELRGRSGLPPRTFAAVVDALVERGELRDNGASIATAGWEPRLTPQQQQQVDAYLTSLRTTPFSPPADTPPPDDLLAYLVESGAVIDCGSGAVFAREAFEAMTAQVVEALKAQGTITLGQVRDLLGSSRRYIQPFLEELDRRHVTMRRGDERLLRRE
ncbi:MAG TPA: selenocysteine-specific translation elongation factor [Dehalococcoidia bacterium]|jgi:selenocysteine-specific elongation factor|nr:selenocysteine-specific translation elongation factor [Dehalococcoidia bacterium]